MENEIFIDEFGYEMEEIQLEKLSKYKDSWKTTPYNTLITKTLDQMENLVLSKDLGKNFKDFTIEEKEEMKRATIHIANYCFFLYNRLGE